MEATTKRVVGARKSRWETREIRGARRERNRLRRDLNSNMEDWVRKSREVHEMTVAARRKTWKKDLQTIAETRDTKKTWDLVKRMEGKNPTGGPQSAPLQRKIVHHP